MCFVCIGIGMGMEGGGRDGLKKAPVSKFRSWAEGAEQKKRLKIGSIAIQTAKLGTSYRCMWTFNETSIWLSRIRIL